MLASSDDGKHEYEDIELSTGVSRSVTAGHDHNKMLTALARMTSSTVSRGKSNIPPPPPVRTVSFDKTRNTTVNKKRHSDQDGQNRAESPKVPNVWATKMSQFESALQQFQSKYKKQEKRNPKEEERKEKKDEDAKSECLATKQENAKGLETVEERGTEEMLNITSDSASADRSCEQPDVQVRLM
jgi:hypothetical protein